MTNTKDTFAENLQLQMSVLHQNMYILRVSSQVHMMAG